MVQIQNYYNTTKTNIDSTAFALNIAANIIQQSGVLESIWSAVLNPQPAPSSQTSTNPSSSTTESSEEKPTEPEKTDNEIKEDVINLLKNNSSVNVDFKSEEGKQIMTDVVRKYTAIKSLNPNISDADLSKRLGNYINGYLYHCKEHQFGLQSMGEDMGISAKASNDKIVNEDVDNANKNKDMTAFTDAFHQQAKEYIEFYDSNSDNKIDFEELYNVEVKETIELYGNDLSSKEIAELKDDITTKVARKIANYDKNNDNKLDENEISGYMWARNRWQDDGATLTYEEYKGFENAMNGDMASPDAQKAQQAFENGYEGLYRKL